ncbi:MAG: glycerophosphodiester phosphodiesterase family protein [Devosia sp.]
MRIAAHRGTRLHAPENSRQALISAYTAGADVLEFDVQLAKHDPQSTTNSRVVVSHDGTTDRLTGESGRILDLTVRELRHTSGKYDFSATFNPFGDTDFHYYRPGRRLQIEVFEDMLDLLPRDIPLLIELKHDSSPDAATRKTFVAAVIECLGNRGLFDNVVIYSKDPGSLTLARELHGDLRIAAFDWERSADEQLALVGELGADGLVTDVASVVGDDGALTQMGQAFEKLYRVRDLRVGAVLYPFRRPGVFTQAEYNALKERDFVWSLSTDSMLSAQVEGEQVDVAQLLGRQWLWLDEPFAGQRVNRDRWALGYAKAHDRDADNARVYQNDGVHIETREYTGWLPPDQPSSDPVEARVENLEGRMLYAERAWPFYTGGGVGLITGITGDFIAEVDYELKEPLTQATTLELAVVNADPGSHRAEPPQSFRHKNSFFDPHGTPPFAGVEHDEDDGYRINSNLGYEYDNNQYGPPVGDGKTPTAGRLRLERRGPYFSAYYRNNVDAPDWICVGSVRNESLNQTVYLRCAAKRWRQEKADNPSEYWPIVPNTFTFKNLNIMRWRNR